MVFSNQAEISSYITLDLINGLINNPNIAILVIKVHQIWINSDRLVNHPKVCISAWNASKVIKDEMG